MPVRTMPARARITTHKPTGRPKPRATPNTRLANNKNKKKPHDEYDDLLDDLLGDDEDKWIAAMASVVAEHGHDSMGSFNMGRRMSRASIKWFQNETKLEVTEDAGLPSTPPVANLGRSRRRNSGLISKDGSLKDDFILRRQSINKPTQFTAKLKTIPQLADLTDPGITQIDGWVLTQMLLCGYAKMSTKIDELNKINVFPIADGDTGANLKVCLKLPTRNLLLDPSDSIVTVSSNMAADVLLNGQGNSGTILSHFFVSMAEEIKAMGKEMLDTKEWVTVIANVGDKMADAVPNPVEGTLLSVARDACKLLAKHPSVPYANLKELLRVWNEITQEELQKTPDQLIVDGVKVLEKAGVVDSGAQGFAYVVQGMYLASLGQLPEAEDPNLFKAAQASAAEDVAMSVDHTVCDTRYQFCTEGVVLLKDGFTKKDVLEAVSGNEELGDSIASVGAPAKGGGNMVKVHIHSNRPQAFFEKLLEFSRDPILKKEKVEDMWMMREHAHEEENMFELSEAKFTIMGMCDNVLPAVARNPENALTFPVFMVPSTTQEPIDTRFASDSETCNALNAQRHESTAIRYTSAASNPMQIKIELLAALGKGLPVLIILISKDKRVSALGRNVMVGISMLTQEQQKKIKVLVHGWVFYEVALLMEALRLMEAGKTLDEAYTAVEDFSNRSFVFANFATAPTVKKLLEWRPGLFPDGFAVQEDDAFFAFGLDPEIREGEPIPVSERVDLLMNIQNKASSLEELEDLEIERIRSSLKTGQKLSDLILPCIGRPDYGHRFLRKLRDAGIEVVGKPLVFNTGFMTVATGALGEFMFLYKIVEGPTEQ